MDWSITNKYEDANHHPIAVLNNDKSRRVLEITASAGEEIKLNAANSSDPDGHTLNYSWLFYKEPGSYKGSVEIPNATGQQAKLVIPEDARGKSIHIILEIHDNGTPNLYAYRRLIIYVKP
jgi:hypothetical protein